MNRQITQDFLLEILEYDETSGKLFWKTRGPHLFEDGKWSAETRCNAFNKRFSGKEALIATDPDGYNVGTLLGKDIFVHRIIWLMKTGEWPQGQVDHKNGVRDDNHWENLRDVSISVNSRNTADISGRNSSGKTGVMWKESVQRWRVRIGVGEKRVKELGYYRTFEQAVKVREEAEHRYGYTSRHGVS